jgi:RND family efflux transporter MFP subunit
MQAAIHHESERLGELQDGGFVSPNELEQKSAESASKQAQVLALQAQMLGSSLQVNDCVLRAPFDGDIAERMADPGAFVRPGTFIVSVVDRSIIRLTADVPEDDFGAVRPGETLARIHVIPTDETLTEKITRRAPAADPSTRTVHIEIDISDPRHHIPVYTTAEISIDVGEPVQATELPLAAVSIRGNKASLFTIKDGKAVAKTVPVFGESGGNVFLDPSLAADTPVVLQGRTLLADGDAVESKRAEDVAKTAEVTPPEKAKTAP